MTIRSLFKICLKVLGIFFIKDILASLPQLLSLIILIAKPDGPENAAMTLGFTLLMLLIYVFVCYCLIFKSDAIIDSLKLDKDFVQEDVSLNIHRSTILTVCIILLGGLILTQEIPNFCRLLYLYFAERRSTFGQTNPNTSYLILAVVKVIIGLVLVGNAGLITNFIELKRKK